MSEPSEWPTDPSTVAILTELLLAQLSPERRETALVLISAELAKVLRFAEGTPVETPSTSESQETAEIGVGTRVRTADKLDDARGMMVAPKYIECRRCGITGVVKGYVPGHGGDVWWVAHDGTADVGAYCYTEITPV